MWADRYLYITLQLKFRNNIELGIVLEVALEVNVNTKYYTYI
jgi:hypothetical protein